MESTKPIAFDIGMTAEQIIDACKDEPGQHTSLSMLPDGRLPQLPPAPATLSDEQLAPPAPFVFLQKKCDAFSSQLEQFCLKHPVAVVRGLSSTLNLDLSLFSTKTLTKAWPQHVVEERRQIMQSADENWDATGRRRVWACSSQHSLTTIQKYAQYQARCFLKSLKEEREGGALATGSVVGTSSGGPIRRGRKHLLRFGTNVDLSDEEKWLPQLTELQKLPAFCRVTSPANMLSHVDHMILGVNTVQLYMKVPGSRTPAHQENNNFCSVNINIGPGDCEWFAVPNDYWGVIYELCKHHGVNYLQGSWWPDLEELRAHGVPVYRFTQRSGDLVWVNPGCVHWVQATGLCNSIAWNVGPLTARQYRLSLERYEWNKTQNFMSLVPMINLSWNLARNINVSEPEFHKAIRTCLMQALRTAAATLALVKAKNVKISFHGRMKGEISHYCHACKRVVWHALFIRKQESEVHCLECAQSAEPSLQGFLCLEEDSLDELAQVYDAFTLHKPPPLTALDVYTAQSLFFI